jgi:hypothetical protein
VRISLRVVVAALTVSLVGYLVLVGVSWAAAPPAPGNVCAAIPRDLIERFSPGFQGDPNHAEWSPWEQRCIVVAADSPPRTATYDRWSELWVRYYRCHEPPLHPRAQTDCAHRRFANLKWSYTHWDDGTAREVRGLGDAAFVALPNKLQFGVGPDLFVLRGADVLSIVFWAEPSTVELMMAAGVELAKAMLAGIR